MPGKPSILSDMDDLIERARAWIAEDPDPATRAELQAALDSDDRAALEAAFGPALEFGTAGIRGPLGAGPARMNRLVVRHVTAGLAARLAVEAAPESQIVVVGRDARHNSEAFAADVVGVLRGAGFEVLAFAEPVPTPLLAYAVRHLGAAAGVQITASHNPPADNGYKVYWSSGAQINAPIDAEIAEAIATVTAGGPVPVDEAPVDAPPPRVLERYLEACLSVPVADAPRQLRIVYTALHGVAGDIMLAALRAAGFEDVHAVAEQLEPDPAFPTVGFPNPEEEGALDLALALASEADADLLLANDPDGDRIAAAVPGETAWRVLSGDEVGCLLAEDLLARGSGGDRHVATTVVSSQMLGRIAEAHGVSSEETLTGFKWLAPAMADARSRGLEPVLAYEQALGVMIGDAVLDKDGISAALALADLAARLRAAGRTLDDALDDLARAHGVHTTTGRSLRLPGGPPEAVEAVRRVLADPPSEVAGIPVAAVADHTSAVRRHADGSEATLSTPPTDLVGLELTDGSRVQARPSGTEPLLKCYIEAVEPVGSDGLPAARARSEQRAEALADAFLALIPG